MNAPLSLRLARLLLVAASALTAGVAAYITVASADALGAWPWLSLLMVDAAGFIAAAMLLTRNPRRASLIAVGSALGMSALGVITGFGAGMLSLPAAGVGALAAWAALLHPPRRPVVLAFVAYLGIGVALSVPTFGVALLYPWTLATVFIWPVRLLLFPPSSFIAIQFVLGLAASAALLAFTRPRIPPAPLGTAAWLVILVVTGAAGAAAALIFEAIAFARVDTSARFELDPLVLGVVFAGAVLAAAGSLGIRFRPGVAGAFALGIGGALLFLVFTYRPAITCHEGGSGQGVPLAWMLRDTFERPAGGGGLSSGGSSGTISGGGSSRVATGYIRSGDREIRFRCEGGRLVEYRKVAR